MMQEAEALTADVWVRVRVTRIRVVSNVVLAAGAGVAALSVARAARFLAACTDTGSPQKGSTTNFRQEAGMQLGLM